MTIEITNEMVGAAQRALGDGDFERVRGALTAAMTVADSTTPVKVVGFDTAPLIEALSTLTAALSEARFIPERAAEPAWVVDGDGDCWERQVGDRYIVPAGGGPYTLDRIEELYGIKERGPSS